MKKIVIILTALIIFSICLLVGFQIGDRLLPERPTVTPGAAQSIQQQNIFLIRVDKLKQPKPNLVSVWVLFLYYSSNAPGITFLPVYQQDGSVPHPAPLDQLFSLQPDGSVSPEFLQALKANLNLSVDGYIILDNQALESFAHRFPGENPSPEPFQITIPDERQTVKNLCGLLKDKKTRDIELPWKEVLPDHFHTNLNFTAFMANWIRLTQAAVPPNCELIPKP